MSDLISRQDAIKEIKRNAYRHTYIEQIIGIIENLPSAEPKKGEWIKQSDPNSKLFDWYLCSECGSVIGMDDANFCSNCGADMRGEA